MDLALKAVDAAHDARTFDEFLAKIAALLAHGLRADFVLLQRFSATEVNPHGLVGMSTKLAEECRRNIPRYMQEMPEITEELMQGKVLSIRESVPAERYERLAFVREIFHQLGNATDLQMVTMGRPDSRAFVALGRAATKPFSATEREQLGQASKAIGLGLSLHLGANVRSATNAVIQELGELDRAIVDYAVRGYTNAQIALCLERSPNTIRNRLANIFEQVGVASRTELVFALMTRL